LPGSYHVIPHFSLIPVEMSQLCDRIFYLSLQARKLNAEIAPGKTVNYHCLWEAIYHAAGETPPPNAKETIDCRPIKTWLNLQDARQLEIIYRRCGCNIDFEFPPVTSDGQLDAASSKEGGALSQNVEFQQARQLHKNGKFADAALLYQEILAEDPAEPNALHFFGVLHAQRGDYETAADLIGRSIAVNPYNAIAYYNHGKALRDANRHEDALSSYDRAIALLPSNVDAWSNRGIILQELGRSREAVESFDRALALSPSHGPSLHNRANALRALSRNDEAIGQL
jgi:Tfp pilus assembly protein PilF